MYRLKISGSGYGDGGESLGDAATLAQARAKAASTLDTMDQYVTAMDEDGVLAHYSLGGFDDDHILVYPVRVQTIPELPA